VNFWDRYGLYQDPRPRQRPAAQAVNVGPGYQGGVSIQTTPGGAFVPQAPPTGPVYYSPPPGAPVATPCTPPDPYPTTQDAINQWNFDNPGCPPLPSLTFTTLHPIATGLPGAGVGATTTVNPATPPSSAPATGIQTSTGQTCNNILIAFLAMNPVYGTVSGTVAQPTQAGLTAFLAANPNCANDPTIQYYQQQINALTYPPVAAQASTPSWFTTTNILIAAGVVAAAGIGYWLLSKPSAAPSEPTQPSQPQPEEGT
jgi:hypothetical protein